MSVKMLTGGTYLQGSRLALVHIPVRLYPYFLQPILRVLFGTDESIPIESSQTQSDFDEPKTWMNRHLFLNVSLTPVECSVFCSRALADEIFKPLAEDFNAVVEGWEERVGDSISPRDGDNEKITIYPDDYVAIEVNGQGDAGQRVLELTAPLAMAGIPIFFKTTYYCDYILVPTRNIQQVNHVLEQNGFTFSADSATFSSPGLQKPISASHRGSSSTIDSIRPASLRTSTPPSTPPATSVSELQVRTFDRLRASGSSTVTDDDDAVLVPITLDLRDLPMEATGIVCGVAGRVGATGADLSFLSTARAGTLLVRLQEIDDAIRALKEGVEEAEQVKSELENPELEKLELAES
ncbi:MAG: hypothetical protein Q9160_001521 [Pyrenula sp. 1 TL-2023]